MVRRRPQCQVPHDRPRSDRRREGIGDERIGPSSKSLLLTRTRPCPSSNVNTALALEPMAAAARSKTSVWPAAASKTKVSVSPGLSNVPQTPPGNDRAFAAGRLVVRLCLDRLRQVIDVQLLAACAAGRDDGQLIDAAGQCRRRGCFQPDFVARVASCGSSLTAICGWFVLISLTPARFMPDSLMLGRDASLDAARRNRGQLWAGGWEECPPADASRQMLKPLLRV